MLSQSELMFIAFWTGMAMALAALTVTGLGAALQIDRLIGRRVAITVVPIMGLGIALGSMLSGRNLPRVYSAYALIGPLAEPSGTGPLRLFTLILLVTCGATVLSRLFESRVHISRAIVPGRLLMGAFIVYYLCNAWLNAFLGSVPTFTHQTLYVPVVVAAVFVWRDQPIEPFLGTAKWTLVGFMILSLVLAVVKPDLAVQPGYRGWLPGLTFRLWGVGSNPNSLGPLAVLLALLEFAIPSRRTRSHWFILSLALVVLLLAQSKTAWGAAVLIGLLLSWYRWSRVPGGGIRIGFALVVIAFLAASVFALLLGDPLRQWERLAGAQIGDDVATLTGRLEIWAAALDAWRENPLFGYGPSAWNWTHRLSIGLRFASSAHNQFLQSLSVAGLFGLVSLLFYIGVLFRGCSRAAQSTNGFSLALLGLVLIRSVTEAPFSAMTLFNGDVLTQLVLFRVALLGFVSSREVRQNWYLRSAGGHSATNASA